MSVKIYTAYRLRTPRRFETVLQDLYEKGKKSTSVELRGVYRQLFRDVRTDTKEYKEFKENRYIRDEFLIRLALLETFLRRSYREQASSSLRDLFDFDVSLSVTFFRKQVLLIPHADMLLRDVWKFLDEESELEPFGYWDNTDRDASVSAEDWGRRRRLWTAIIDKKVRSLHLEVSCQDSFYEVDPHIDIVKEYSALDDQDKQKMFAEWMGGSKK